MPRSKQGKLAKLSPKHKAERASRRARKGTHAARVWARRHVQQENSIPARMERLRREREQ
jgi:hypothetical protein